MNGSGMRIGLVSHLTAVLLLLFASVLAHAQTKHPVVLDDFDKLQYAMFLQLSPNGKMLVYSAPEGDLFILASEPGSLPRKVAKGSFPLWSSDGKHVAYYSKESGTQQLWVLDIDSWRAEEVTRLEGGIDPDLWTRLTGWVYDPLRYSWSPDGTKLVFPSQAVVTHPNLRSQIA